MQELVAYFEHIPPAVRGGIFIGGLVFFWTMEGLIPLFGNNYQKVRHAGINLFFTLFNFAVALAFAFLLLKASNFTSVNEFGLLYIIELPLMLNIVLGVVLLDLVGAYFAHWTLHKVKWMWKFHVIHHSDTNVDVTTGFRHHPGEVLIRLIFTIFGVLALGLPMGIVMLYQTLSLIFAQVTHANISVPDAIDRPLSYLFITPNMHKVHHHFRQPYTDSNYGNIFGFWDRIFGTFQQIHDTKSIIYGIDTHLDPAENDKIGNLLAIPFQEYRDPHGINVNESESTVTRVQ